MRVSLALALGCCAGMTGAFAPRGGGEAARLAPHTPTTRTISPRLCAATAPASTAPASFERWCDEAGIEATLRVTEAATLRGAVAVRRVDPGEPLCVLPRTRCLDLADTIGRSPCPELAPTALWESLAWQQRLAVWLIAERRQGEASAVSGYISFLPQPDAFADAPLQWTDQELAELR